MIEKLQVKIDQETKARLAYNAWHQKQTMGKILDTLLTHAYVYNNTVYIISDPSKHPYASDVQNRISLEKDSTS